MDREYFLNKAVSLPAVQLFIAIYKEIITLEDLIQIGKVDSIKIDQIMVMMAKRKELLEKTEFEGKAEELFHAITNGIVTLPDLISTSSLPLTERQIIQKLIQGWKLQEDDFWKKNKDTLDGLKEIVALNPAGTYFMEAIRLIEEKQGKSDDIITKLQISTNSFTPEVIRNYLQSNIITMEDLLKVGVPSNIVTKINSSDSLVGTQLDLGDRPDCLPDGFTEVYFWGGPGSGKTSALAALLSTASNSTKFSLDLAQGPGFNYMVQLTNVFCDSVAILPGLNNVEDTQYLPFALKKRGESNSRSVSLIELSGEIFQCFFYKIANKPFPTESHQETFDLLTQYLSSDNPKMHFFFIDCNNNNRPDAYGHRQSDYLNAAAIYFRDNDIFKDKTQAIYVVLTKSDLMECQKHERKEYLQSYLQNNGYTNLVDSLRSRCEESSINGKRLLGIEFTLGDVYFGKLCNFDSTTAENMMDILMNRIKPQRNSISNWFNS